MRLDSATLILAANGVFGLLWLGAAAIAASNGNGQAALTWAVLGLLFVGLGVALYRTRRRRTEAEAGPT